MRKFVKKLQGGAVSGYVIGVVLLALVLVGGVVLLKNNNSGRVSVSNQPVTVQTETTNQSDKDSAKTSNTSTSGSTDGEKTGSTGEKTSNSTTATNTATTANTNTTATVATTETDTLTSTGATSDYVPTDLVQTGPADTFAAIFGVVLILAAGYAFYRYKESTKAVEQKLLEK